MEHEIIHEELTVLKEIRKKKKMSQQEVAEKAECNQSFYGKVERGIVDVSLIKLKPMLAAMGAKMVIKG
jgi:transcriptional regulator with XRE-family HTH domain